MRATVTSIALALLLAPRLARGACDTAPATPSDRRVNSSSARVAVATFNARWLFDGVNDISLSPYVDDATGARAHADDVRDVVTALDADVVVVTEHENCETLAWAGGGTGSFASYFTPGTDSATTQEVGLLTVDVDVDEDRHRQLQGWGYFCYEQTRRTD